MLTRGFPTFPCCPGVRATAWAVLRSWGGCCSPKATHFREPVGLVWAVASQVSGLRCPGREADKGGGGGVSGLLYVVVCFSLYQRLPLIVSTPKLPPRYVTPPLGHPSQGSRHFPLSYLLPQNPRSFFSSGARGEARLHRRCPPSEQ